MLGSRTLDTFLTLTSPIIFVLIFPSLEILQISSLGVRYLLLSRPLNPFALAQLTKMTYSLILMNPLFQNPIIQDISLTDPC